MTDKELNKYISRMYKANITAEEAVSILKKDGITVEQIERIKDMPPDYSCD